MSIFKIKTKKDSVVVKVTLPSFDPNRHPRMRVTTNDVEKHLEEKEILQKKLKTKLTKEFILMLQCDESRSQHKNKEIVIKRFFEVITNGLIVPKKRKPTKPSKSSIKKRLEKKKKQAFKKVFRRKPNLE